MARPNKKTVYERITEQQNKIHETEELLSKLNEELQELYKEKDNYINAMNASNQQDAIASIVNLIKEAH